MKKKLALSTCIVGLFLGCGAPFRCFEERIEVSWPTTITRGAEQERATLAGLVAPGNIGESLFAELKSVLVNEAPAQPFGLVWSVPAFNTNGGGIALALAGPLQRDEVLRITSSFQGGGWGRFSLPSGERAQVSVAAENFVAITAAGTIEVLQTAPLVLRLDLLARDANNAMLRISGEASFRLVREPAPCT